MESAMDDESAVGVVSVDEPAVFQATVESVSDVPILSAAQVDPYGDNPQKRRVFDRDQVAVLERYFDNGMNSTHRRNKELIDQAAEEVGVSADKVKNWIGAETVRRKRQALAAIAAKSPLLTQHGGTPTSPLPAKRKRASLSGYNMFFASFVKDNPEVTQERTALAAARWKSLTEEDREEWQQKAYAHEESLVSGQLVTAVEGRDQVISCAVSLLQSCLERLDQVGVHSYCLLVDPVQMKTHTLASALGQQFHQQQQTLPPQQTSAVLTEGNADVHENGDVAASESNQPTPMVSESHSIYSAFSRYVLSNTLHQQSQAAVPQATEVSTASTDGSAQSAVTMPLTTVGSLTSSSLGLSTPISVMSPTASTSQVYPCRYTSPDEDYVCPYVAPSPHFLRAHRQDTGHAAKRGRPRKSTTSSSSLGLTSISSDTVLSPTTTLLTTGPTTVTTGSSSEMPDLSVEHMQMLVRNTFNTKYEEVTGQKTVPYDDAVALQNIVVVGLPESLRLQRPRTYTTEQLRAIVSQLGRVVFVKVDQVKTPSSTADSAGLDISSSITNVIISDAEPAITTTTTDSETALGLMADHSYSNISVVMTTGDDGEMHVQTLDHAPSAAEPVSMTTEETSLIANESV